MKKEANQSEIRATNAMIYELAPDELEAFSQAETILQTAEHAEIALLARVKERELNDWHDSINPEIKVILSQLSMEEREFCARAYPEELGELANLQDKKADAMMAMRNLMLQAAKRMRQREKPNA